MSIIHNGLALYIAFKSLWIIRSPSTGHDTQSASAKGRRRANPWLMAAHKIVYYMILSWVYFSSAIFFFYISLTHSLPGYAYFFFSFSDSIYLFIRTAAGGRQQEKIKNDVVVYAPIHMVFYETILCLHIMLGVFIMEQTTSQLTPRGEGFSRMPIGVGENSQ